MMKMKKVLFYAFLLPAFVGMMFSCSDVKTDVKKLEGKWNVEIQAVIYSIRRSR